MSEKRSVDIGGEMIEYTLTRRKMKNIRLRITVDGTLAVSAPARTSLGEIERVVVKHADWIRSATKKFAAQIPPTQKREYYTGEKFLYLGVEYTLVATKNSKEGVSERGEYIFLQVRDLDDIERKAMLIDRWYIKQIVKVFGERFFAQVERFRALFPDDYTLKIRAMTSRWGSCMINKNTVTLNSKLIYADVALLDYVILHELCHFKFKNHDKDFYALLGKLCPNWKEYRKALGDGVYIYYNH